MIPFSSHHLKRARFFLNTRQFLQTKANNRPEHVPTFWFLLGGDSACSYALSRYSVKYREPRSYRSSLLVFARRTLENTDSAVQKHIFEKEMTR